MNIAQPVILKPPVLRSIGRAYPPALSGGQLGKSCASFGANQAQPWNPFSSLFGIIHQIFTSFSETRVGQWLGTWLKKINNFLQAPKKETPKAASSVPSPAPASPIDSQTAPIISPEPAPTIAEPPTSQPMGETPPQPPPQQAKSKAAPKHITPHEKLMAKSKRLLAAQKGIEYSTLSKEALLEKLSAFEQAQQHCQSQQRRLSKELKSLEALKNSQTKLLEATMLACKKLKLECEKLKKELESSDCPVMDGIKPKSELELEYKRTAQKRKAQKRLISELKKVLEVLDSKIQAHSTAFEEAQSQFEKMTCEVQMLEFWIDTQTLLRKNQPLPAKFG